MIDFRILARCRHLIKAITGNSQKIIRQDITTALSKMSTILTFFSACHSQHENKRIS